VRSGPPPVLSVAWGANAQGSNTQDDGG